MVVVSDAKCSQGQDGAASTKVTDDPTSEGPTRQTQMVRDRKRRKPIPAFAGPALAMAYYGVLNESGRLIDYIFYLWQSIKRNTISHSTFCDPNIRISFQVICGGF